MFLIEPETVLYLHRQKTERLMKQIPHLLAVAEAGRPMAQRVQHFWHQLLSRKVAEPARSTCCAAPKCC